MSTAASRSFVTFTPNHELRNSISSLNVIWNIANMTATNIGIAHILCVSTLSALSDRDSHDLRSARFKHGEKFFAMYVYRASATNASVSPP